MLLAKEGVDVNQAVNDGATPLFVASQKGHTAVVSMLLGKQGVDVNQAMDGGTTPLLTASWHGHTAVVSMLLAKQGVKVNQTAKDGITPLYGASRNGNTAVVERLLAKQGVDVNQAAKNGATPLFAASWHGHTKVVALLLESKGGKKIVDSRETRYNKTPLMAACMNGSKTIVEILLANCAAVNLKDKTGETALGIACKKGKDELVRLLFDAGASFPDDPSEKMEKVLVRVIGLEYVESIGNSRAAKFHRDEGPNWWETVECAVCYEKLAKLDSTGKIMEWHTRRCGHSFHNKCIEKWYDRNNGNKHGLDCPMCRRRGVCFDNHPKIPKVQETYRNLRF